MPSLTPVQSEILSVLAARPEGLALPEPPHLTGAVNRLVEIGLAVKSSGRLEITPAGHIRASALHWPPKLDPHAVH